MRAIGNKTAGFTLIEMLVGIAIGMIVVAAASVMMVSTLKSQKDITASARLNQELGAAMAVMSNEIRRAGFSICDIKKMDDAGSNCPLNPVDGEEVPYILYNTSASNKDLEIFDVDGVGNDDGDCILYRYNADVDDVDDLQEQRGFRFNSVTNTIQMGDVAQNFACTDPETPPTPPTWIDLTDPNVIDITDLSFSTAGSRCRNMTLPDPNPDPAVVAQYWVVRDAATGMACDDNSDTVDYCIVTVNALPPNVTTCTTSVTKAIASGDKLFGTRQIVITLEATLARDQAVTKRLESSVKVANPRIEIVP